MIRNQKDRKFAELTSTSSTIFLPDPNSKRHLRWHSCSFKQRDPEVLGPACQVSATLFGTAVLLHSLHLNLPTGHHFLPDMALTPLLMPSRAFHAPSNAALAVLSSALRDLRISASANQRRNASHQAQGRANGAKDGPGKRLGAKKSAGEYVVPGNIIFKQRGTHWFPGDHCTMVCEPERP